MSELVGFLNGLDQGPEREALLDLITLLALPAVGAKGLPPEARRRLELRFKSLDLDAASSIKEIEAAFEAYFRGQPRLSEQLVALKQLLQRASGGNALELDREALALLGARPVSLPQERGAAGTPAGPLARHLLARRDPTEQD